MARGKAGTLVLSDAGRNELQALVRRQKTGQALARRARIVLLAADGLTNTAIAVRLGVAKHTAGTWRGRFARPARRAARRAAARSAAADRRRGGRGDGP